MKATFHILWVLTLLIVGFGGSGIATAQSTPQMMKVQGFLSDTSGGSSVPASGTFSMTFDLYDANLGGLLVNSIGPSSVVVTDGLYAVELPFPNTDFDSPNRWIEITVDGETLSPRIRVVSTPFAYIAEKLDGFEGADLEESAEIVAGDTNLQDQIDTVSVQLLAVGNTLDEAYDEGGPGAGRIITTDAGPVGIAGPNGLFVDGGVGIGVTASPLGRLTVGDEANPTVNSRVYVNTTDIAYQAAIRDPLFSPNGAQTLVSYLAKATLESETRILWNWDLSRMTTVEATRIVGSARELQLSWRIPIAVLGKSDLGS